MMFIDLIPWRLTVKVVHQPYVLVYKVGLQSEKLLITTLLLVYSDYDGLFQCQHSFLYNVLLYTYLTLFAFLLSGQQFIFKRPVVTFCAVESKYQFSKGLFIIYCWGGGDLQQGHNFFIKTIWGHTFEYNCWGGHQQFQHNIFSYFNYLKELK